MVNEYRGSLVREFVPYINEQAYFQSLVAPFAYTFWQPWLKDYHDE